MPTSIKFIPEYFVYPTEKLLPGEPFNLSCRAIVEGEDQPAGDTTSWHLFIKDVVHNTDYLRVYLGRPHQTMYRFGEQREFSIGLIMPEEDLQTYFTLWKAENGIWTEEDRFPASGFINIELERDGVITLERDKISIPTSIQPSENFTFSIYTKNTRADNLAWINIIEQQCDEDGNVLGSRTLIDVQSEEPISTNNGFIVPNILTTEPEEGFLRFIVSSGHINWQTGERILDDSQEYITTAEVTKWLAYLGVLGAVAFTGAICYALARRK